MHREYRSLTENPPTFYILPTFHTIPQTMSTTWNESTKREWIPLVKRLYYSGSYRFLSERWRMDGYFYIQKKPAWCSILGATSKKGLDFYLNDSRLPKWPFVRAWCETSSPITQGNVAENVEWMKWYLINRVIHNRETRKLNDEWKVIYRKWIYLIFIQLLKTEYLNLKFCHRLGMIFNTNGNVTD